MAVRRFLVWFRRLFSRKKVVRLGLYGAPNAGKTSLANVISLDWTGKPLGHVSELPHETRTVKKKERVILRSGGKKLELDLLDMPGISTRDELYGLHYDVFIESGLSEIRAHKRVVEARRGVIEAVRWLARVDAILLVVDASKDPGSQVNEILLRRLTAKAIPVIVVANKMDLKSADADRVREFFTNLPVIEVSCKKRKNIEKLYKAVAEYHL